MAPPLALELIVQKGTVDCSLAAVAMIAGRPYADAARHARRMAWKADAGLYPSQIQTLAQAMGVRLTRRRRPVYDEESTGVLLVRDEKDWALHAVVLFHGVVVNPADGVLYSREAFFAKGWSPRVWLEAA